MGLCEKVANAVPLGFLIDFLDAEQNPFKPRRTR
jgi:hypothetical protein